MWGYCFNGEAISIRDLQTESGWDAVNKDNISPKSFAKYFSYHTPIGKVSIFQKILSFSL